MAAPIRVLYVDDDPFLLDIGKLFLEQSGDFTVLTALSAPEALRLIEPETVDVIVSDYQMPGMDGIQFLSEVRSRFGTIPFILFTGRGREEVVIQAINRGADFYLQKGGEPEAQFAELTQKIKSAAYRKMTEIALRESERVHATMISNLPGFVYRCANDHFWTMEYISDGCREITGYAPDELVGNASGAYYDLVHPEHKKSLWDTIQNSLARGEVFEVEYPLITKEGETRWVWERGRGIYTKDGRLLCLEGFITDITGRKQIEQAAKKREAMLNTAQRVAHLGSWEMDLRNGQFHWSDELYRILGFEPRSFIPQRDSLDTIVHPDDLEPMWAAAEKAIAEKKPFTFVLRIIRPDGETRILQDQGEIHYNNEGVAVRMVGTALDITDMTRAEKDIAFKNIILSTQQETSPDAILIVDENGKILFYNQKFIGIWGVPDGLITTLMDEPLLEFVVGQLADPEKFLSRVRYLYEHNAEKSFEELLLKDGRILERFSAPMLGETGIYYGRVWYFRDITERKRAEEALSRKNQELNTSNEQIAATEEELRQQLDELTEQQAALRISEEKFRAFTENIADLTTIADANGVYTYVSPSLLRLSGRNYEEFVGKKILGLETTLGILPGDIQMLRECGRSALENPGVSIPVPPFRGSYPDGSILYLEGTAIYLPDVQGIRGIIFHGRDITARKNAEEKLRAKNEELNASYGQIAAAEEELRANLDELTRQEQELRESKRELADIIEFLPDATFVIDRQGLVIAWNRAIEEMTGIGKNEMIGQGDHAYAIPFYGERRQLLMDLIDLDDKELSAKYQFVTRKGNTLYAEVFTPALYGGNGAYVWVTGSPLFDDNGNRIGAIESIRDITGWKQTEAALKESEKKYRDIFEHSVTGLFKTTTDGQMIDANHALARMYGYSGAPELLDANINVGQLYASIKDQKEVLQILAEKGIVGDYETLHLKRDGTLFWVSITARTIRNAEGAGIFYEGTIIDITGRKQTEEDLVWKREELEAANVELTATGEELKAQSDTLAANERTILESDGRIRQKHESMPVPGGDISTLDLGDIIDPQVLQPLMDDFTRVTGMATAILDTKGHVLVATGWQEICTKFHRVNPVTAGFCSESDLHLAKNLKQGEYVAYKCRNHLWDVVTPLYIGDRHMGNIFTGQFFYDDEIAPESVFIAQAKTYGFDLDAYMAAFHRVPRFSREKVNELMDYLVKFTGFISRLSYSNLELARTAAERDSLFQSLQVSQDRYRTFVENIPQKFFMKDSDFRYVSINENFARDLGISPEDVVGKTDADLFSAELAAKYLAGDVIVIKSGKTGEFEERYILDGKETWVRMIKTVIRDQKGEITGLLGVFWDITDKKRSEDALADRLVFHEALINSIPYPVFIKDATGRFVGCNRAYEREFKTTQDYLLGKTVLDLEYLSIEERRRFHTEDLEVIATAGRSSYELPIVYADGLIHRTLYSVDGFCLADGRPGGLIGMLVDITERKKAEEALKESETYLSSILHGSPVMQFVLDKNHRVVSWNKAIEEYSGMNEAEVSGTRDQWKAFYDTKRPVLADLMVDEALEKLLELYPGKFSKSPLVKGAYEVTDFFPKMKLNGVWLHFTAAPIRDDKGAIIGAVETLEDITERKIAEEALYQANKKLNLLSGITRHDINNQLMILRGFLALLKKAQPDTSFTEYFQNISNAADRISSMIQFTREYEKIGVNAPAWQDCRTLVDTAAQEVPLKTIELKNTFPSGREVFADPLIVKVFYNLMDNAVRYGKKITTLRFSYEERGGDQILVCEDDGEGVAAEEKEKIFERGFGKNTGMGLFLSRDILSITGITIQETGEPGKGARFEMRVPKGAYRVTGT